METKLNPVQQRIAEGMNPLVAFLTEHTCGEACWQAREDICRCSCGGKNHGCMRSEDGVRPTRTAKIDGFRYELKAVGDRHLYGEVEAINKRNGPKRVEDIKQDGKVVYTYHYWWHETDPGAPARLKPATKQQVTSWPELSAYRENLPDIWGPANRDKCWAQWPGLPYLLWIRVSQ